MCSKAIDFQEQLEQEERAKLKSYACFSGDAQRKNTEAKPATRTNFQRDRERIIHCTAFRRLQHKTQVFLVHEGDLYRTRLTHTLEVVQISRAISRRLGLNEDLTEAIALAHDLGHAPFGHGGEEELDNVLRARKAGSFDHNLHSLRVVDVLEKRYTGFEGLNLCGDTREGLARHKSPWDSPPKHPEFNSKNPSLEAQVVNIADYVAYSTHDLDDALRIGLVEIEDLRGIKLWENVTKEMKTDEHIRLNSLGEELQHKAIIRSLIGLLVDDAVRFGDKAISSLNPRSVHHVRDHSAALVDFSAEIRTAVKELTDFLKGKVYKHPLVEASVSKARKLIHNLFETFSGNPALMPKHFKQRFDAATRNEDKLQVIVDYIAGMTDRFAMEVYDMLFEPRARNLVNLKDW